MVELFVVVLNKMRLFRQKIRYYGIAKIFIYKFDALTS